MTAAPEHGLRPAQCTHCRRDVVWGTLQNGRHRPFDRQPVPAADVVPAGRYAYSRRLRAVVNLDGESRTPALVLVEHSCREYAEWRQQQRDAELLAFTGDPIPANATSTWN